MVQLQTQPLELEVDEELGLDDTTIAYANHACHDTRD